MTRQPLDDATRAKVVQTTGQPLEGAVDVSLNDPMADARGTLGIAENGLIRLSSRTPGPDHPLGAKVRLHEAIHLAQMGSSSHVPSSRDRVETEARQATAAGLEGRLHPLKENASRDEGYHFEDEEVAPDVPLPEAESPKKGLTDAQKQRLANARTTLGKVDPLDPTQQKTLQRYFQGEGLMLDLFERDEKRQTLETLQQDLDQPAGHDDDREHEFQDLDLLQSQLQALDQRIEQRLGELGQTETSFFRFIREELPALFQQRGVQIALVQLEDNRNLVLEEAARYSLEEGNIQDREGLRDSARTLVETLKTLKASIHAPAQVTDPQQKAVAISTARRESSEAFDLLSGARLQHPVLFALLEFLPSDRDGFWNRMHGSAALSAVKRLGQLVQASDEELSLLCGEPLQELLENIDSTASNLQGGELKAWNLPAISTMVFDDLQIGPKSPYRRVIQEHASGESFERLMVDVALSALAISTGVLATVFSGGTLTPLLLTGASALIGGFQVSEHLKRYLVENAAENVALDPRIADLSAGEPDLFWLLLDIVGVLVDVAAVVATFKALKGPVRALLAGEEGALKALEVTSKDHLPPAGSKKVIQHGLARSASGVAESALDPIDLERVIRSRIFKGEAQVNVKIGGELSVGSKDSMVLVNVPAQMTSDEAVEAVAGLLKDELRALETTIGETMPGPIKVTRTTDETVYLLDGEKNYQVQVRYGESPAEALKQLRLFQAKAAEALQPTFDWNVVIQQSNVVVGRLLNSPEEAQGVLRRIVAGDAEAMSSLGLGRPPQPLPDFIGEINHIEWGIAQLPDGRCAIIRGDAGAVDWSAFPEVKPLVHSHPASLRKMLTPDRSLSFEEIMGNQAHRVKFLPSVEDIAFCAARRIENHIVQTPYRFDPTSRRVVAGFGEGTDFPLITIRINDPVNNNGIVKARVTIQAQGHQVHQGTIRGFLGHGDLRLAP